MAKKLRLANNGSIWLGVCKGFANYFDVDVVIPRLIFLAICAAGGSGLLIYLIFWLAMPNEGE